MAPYYDQQVGRFARPDPWFGMSTEGGFNVRATTLLVAGWFAVSAVIFALLRADGVVVGQIRRGAAEHLALAMRGDRLSIRGAVRLAVELYDLLYLYPDYDAATLLDEIRGQLR